MSNLFLTPVELGRGPDLLRPGSSTGHLGNGKFAFIVTRFLDEEGRSIFVEPASTGHEHMIIRPNVLKALFGPDLDAVLAEVTSEQGEYEYRDGNYQPTCRKRTVLDHVEIRRRSRDNNVYGRYGTVRGRPVLMLWLACDGWQELVLRIIEALRVPEDAVLTIGTQEVGVVGGVLRSGEEQTATGE